MQQSKGEKVKTLKMGNSWTIKRYAVVAPFPNDICDSMINIAFTCIMKEGENLHVICRT
jgi:hypothetical protein